MILCRENYDQGRSKTASENKDGIDRYIGLYFHLQRKAEEVPLSEEELEQLVLCESVLQKRHELQEFDQWLETAFEIKREGAGQTETVTKP